jgi:hypothetical protein
LCRFIGGITALKTFIFAPISFMIEELGAEESEPTSIAKGQEAGGAIAIS